MAGEPIQEVELWDLVSAFGRIMRETEAARPSSIVYDDTPIHVYMGRIHARLLEKGRLSLPRPVRAEHAQIDAGRHLPGHLGTGPPSPHPRGAEHAVRRDLDSAEPRMHRPAGLVGRG